MTKVRYEVQIQNKARIFFDSSTDALKYAQQYVYCAIVYGTYDEICYKLESGEIFRYSYGFNSVDIIPHNTN